MGATTKNHALIKTYWLKALVYSLSNSQLENREYQKN